MKHLNMLVWLGLLGLSAQAAPTKTVTIGLGYIKNVQFTPFYIADKLGYYKAQGLDVQFQHGYVTELMPLLLQGKLDAVVGDPEDAIFARSQGAPVKYIMAMYQKSPVTLFSLKPLASAQALRGKTLGIPGTFGSTYAATRAYLQSAGLSETRDVRLATIGFTQLEALRGGKVDAAVGYINNEVVQLRAQGQKVYTLNLARAYPMVGVGLITTEQKLSSDITAKIVRASQRGVQYTVQNPVKAYQLARPIFGQGGGTIDVLKASLPLMKSSYTQKNGLGASDPANWEKAVAALVKQGQLPSAKASDFYSNALIDSKIR